MNIQYKLSTDLVRPGVMPRIDVVQGDIYTRSVELSFYNNEYLWMIPDDAHISVRYAKPDGTRGIYDKLPDGTAACSTCDNMVEFTLAPQMLTVPGAVHTQVVILQGKKQLATFSMQIYVNSDPSAGATTSEDYVNWMDTAIGTQVDRIFREAVDSGVFDGPAGPAGKTPKIATARFSENTRTGVKLTVTNPGEGNQLDQVSQVQIFDGERGIPGVTPNIQKVEVEMLEADMAAEGEISGTPTELTLKLGIPKGTPGRNGDTPAFRLVNAYALPYGALPEAILSGPTADLRLQFGIPAGAPGYTPQKGVDYNDGETPWIKTSGFQSTDGRGGVQIDVYNSGSAAVPNQTVRLYDGKEYVPKPVFYYCNNANDPLHPYGNMDAQASAADVVSAYFRGEAYVKESVYAPGRIVGFRISQTENPAYACAVNYNGILTAYKMGATGGEVMAEMEYYLVQG